MDGFVAKPYTLAALASALSPWLAAGAGAPEAPQPTAPLPAPQASIDPSAIALLMSLDEAGSAGLLREVVNGFLASAVSALADIDVALSQQRLNEAARVAHGLKSPAGNVGARTLARQLGEIERCANGADPRSARRWLELARREHARVQHELTTLLKETA